MIEGFALNQNPLNKLMYITNVYVVWLFELFLNTTDNGDSDSTSGGISTGATVGTVIGGVAIIIIIVIIIVAIPCFVLYKKKRKFGETLSTYVYS